MAQNPATIDRSELKRRAEAGEVDTVLAVFPDIYGRLMGKRFDAEYFLSHIAEAGTHACNYLLTVDMEMEPVPGYEFANWQKGYGDFHLVPDFRTLRQATWLDRTALVLCDLHSAEEHAPALIEPAPRSMLLKQIEAASKIGYEAMAASELEYYLFRNSYRDAAAEYRNLEPAGWYLEDYHALQGTREEDYNGLVRRHLKQSGITVESTKGEWGKGQHELNVRYSDVLAMADNHTILKQCAKEIADKLGVSVTFMAKLSDKQAGSSCHVHLSLWRDGRNAFAGRQKLGAGDGGSIEGSGTFLKFLAGWLAHAPEVMVFYAPNVNSYKRYQSGSWAPTRLAWSRDNRTAGFRVVGTAEGLRIECRIPGADCNPYLVYAAALASGLDGIANDMRPPAEFRGDAYHASELPNVPRTLSEAIGLFEQSEFCRRAFGADVVKHYAHFFRTEQAAYDRAVTDWERGRYFERI
ncbi:MAG TPA: glutamine synthetase family protein [Planctomycetaceae bacterium]|jgi:glutamine synthetase|nr:glutamine synthetase family protein [Planctomycetaceae bacterium]